MDRRAKKTKMAIYKAFETLLTQKSYDKISVKNIIDEADIARTTFYDHFETKDALLHEACFTLFEHVFHRYKVEENLHKDDVEALIVHILYHLKDNEYHLTRLLVSQSSDLFLRYFKAYLEEIQIVKRFVEMKKTNVDIDEDFMKNHLSNSFVSMVQWWMKNGMKQSPETMAAYFMAIHAAIF